MVAADTEQNPLSRIVSGVDEVEIYVDLIAKHRINGWQRAMEAVYASERSRGRSIEGAKWVAFAAANRAGKEYGVWGELPMPEKPAYFGGEAAI
jgi:hypothetical protein